MCNAFDGFWGFQEHIKPDNLAEKHRDALFKKFVKKWNGNKLPKVGVISVECWLLLSFDNFPFLLFRADGILPTV